MNESNELTENYVFSGLPSKGNVFALNSFLILLLLGAFALLYSVFKETQRNDFVIKLSILAILLLFIIVYLKRLLQEPSFFKIVDKHFVYRPSFFLLKRKIKIEDLIEIRKIKRNYFLNNLRTKFVYDTLKLTFNGKRKIILVQYNFDNFSELKYKVQQIQKKNSKIKGVK